jgi:hypothetical protein
MPRTVLGKKERGVNKTHRNACPQSRHSDTQTVKMLVRAVEEPEQDGGTGCQGAAGRAGLSRGEDSQKGHLSENLKR